MRGLLIGLQKNWGALCLSMNANGCRLIPRGMGKPLCAMPAIADAGKVAHHGLLPYSAVRLKTTFSNLSGDTFHFLTYNPPTDAAERGGQDRRFMEGL